MATRYRLKLSKLQFCSVVDEPAQPNAKTLLIKRAPGGDKITATARLAKVSDELGLAFFWAFTSTNADGTPHYDLQGDQVDGDFIKAAMEFMTDGGGAVDEMHDGKPGAGQVVFAMPMNPEIASAYGVTTKQSGLMIAIKPTADVLAKLKDGTYTGVSIGGTGVREPVAAKSTTVAKASLYTTEVLGHQHLIDLEYCESTSYNTSEGAEDSHKHAVVRSADGSFMILADSGHTHELAPDQPAVVVVSSDTVVVVQASDGTIAARALHSKSTPHPAVLKTVPKQEIAMPTPEEIKIADLTKRNERLERISKMSGAHKAHFDTLTRDDDAEAFLAKSTSDRDVLVTEIAKRIDEANKVVYVSKSDGAVYRTKDDPRWVDLAKRFDASAESIEKADVRKGAVELLGGMPGDDATHDYIVASIRKGGGDAATIEKATATLKGMKSSSTLGKKAPGAGGDASPEAGTPDDALAALEKGLVGFCKAQKIEKNLWTDGLSAFVQTPEGKALKHAYDEANAS